MSDHHHCFLAHLSPSMETPYPVPVTITPHHHINVFGSFIRINLVRKPVCPRTAIPSSARYESAKHMYQEGWEGGGQIALESLKYSPSYFLFIHTRHQQQQQQQQDARTTKTVGPIPPLVHGLKRRLGPSTSSPPRPRPHSRPHSPRPIARH